jgi:hypothetical protein
MKAPRTAALTLLLFLAFLAPCAGRTVFLGAAVADDIGEDDDGLTVLGGIHAALWEEEFPVEVDLWVYTRWAGEGKHRVSVFLTDEATREVVAEAEDELDFAGGPVSYVSHDLAGTVLPAPGVYGVAVSLDGEVVGETMYYAGGEDEIDETPRLVLSVPAGDGYADEDGWCEVSGIFEYFSFAKFPATDSFSIASVYFSGDDAEHAHAVRILDPAGRALAAPAPQHVAFPWAEMTALVDTFPNIRFPSAGTYAVVVSLDGQDLARFPLAVVKE